MMEEHELVDVVVNKHCVKLRALTSHWTLYMYTGPPNDSLDIEEVYV